jgi:hypothetical protein
MQQKYTVHGRGMVEQQYDCLPCYQNSPRPPEVAGSFANGLTKGGTFVKVYRADHFCSRVEYAGYMRLTCLYHPR